MNDRKESSEGRLQRGERKGQMEVGMEGWGEGGGGAKRKIRKGS